MTEFEQLFFDLCSEIDINSPRIDDLGYMLHHPTSPDSSTDGSKNVCNVCGKT